MKCKMPPRELQFTGGDCSRGLEAERKLGRGAVKCKIIQRELQFTAGVHLRVHFGDLGRGGCEMQFTP